MKTKPSKAEHKRDRLPQIRRGEGEPIRIVLPTGPLADAIEFEDDLVCKGFSEEKAAALLRYGQEQAELSKYPRLINLVPMQEGRTNERDAKTSDTDGTPQTNIQESNGPD